MKRLTNYLFFLDYEYQLEKIIPIKNNPGIYQEEEFVENLFQNLLKTDFKVKEILATNYRKTFPKRVQLGGNVSDLTMEVNSLGQVIHSDSSFLVTFIDVEGACSHPEYYESISGEKSSMEYVDEFSHEIKNSVNIIHGISDLMQNSDKEEAYELISTLDSSVKHLKGLVTNYLLNRKHEGLKWDRIEFDLRNEIDAIINQFKCLNKQETTIINFRLDSSIFPRLIGFPGALRQVLINLLSNAIEHTDQGEVNLEVNLIKEDFDEIVLNFSVTDSGKGIEGEALKGLFKKFQYSTVEKSGFGLGLNISKRILNSIRSDLMVHSEKGKGSSFYFQLPFHKPVLGANLVEKLSSGSKTPSRFIGKRALIVDDDHLNRLVATKMLTKLGLHCDSASNGVLAIQRLYDFNYDLLVLDIQLPLLDGMTLMNLIQTRFPKLKTIISSGSIESPNIEVSGDNRFFSLLRKPYSQKEMEKVLQIEFEDQENPNPQG